jgi:hypothetical protein
MAETKETWVLETAKAYEDKLAKQIRKKKNSTQGGYPKMLIKARIDLVFFIVSLYFGIEKSCFYAQKRQSGLPSNFSEIRGFAFALLKQHYNYSNEMISLHTKFSQNWIARCIYKFSISENSDFEKCELISKQISKSNL